MKTDVKRYYESIDHSILLKQLDKDIAYPFIWRLLVQFVKRSVERGGTFKSITYGISRGCPLSPIIAAYYLKELDNQMEFSAFSYTLVRIPAKAVEYSKRTFCTHFESPSQGSWGVNCQNHRRIK
jgi:retron-type reverse transcriptase